MAKMKVVLIENEKSPLKTIKQTLQDGEFEITSLTSGFDALESLASIGADVIVSATNLPDLSGYQLSCLLKSNNSTSLLPIVLVNTNGKDEDDFWAKAALADLQIDLNDVQATKTLPGLINNLISTAKKEGFVPQDLKGKSALVGSFSSANLLTSYEYLVNNLLIERLVGRLTRSMSVTIEPRKKFLDQFFFLMAQFFNCPLTGIVLASTGSPWASFSIKDAVSKKAFNSLVTNVTKQLEIHKELNVDVRGEFSETENSPLGAPTIFPIKSESTTIGALIFASNKENKFADTRNVILSQLQVQMQPIMRLLLANQEIESLYQREQYRASTDPLTGLYNLEFLVGFLQQQLLFSYRQRSPVGLIIVDLDSFKQVNDEYGYEIGDLVLSTIANKLLNQTRSSDLVARYGGDEFAVVAPNTDLSGAKVLAEKIRLEVEQMSFVKGPGRKGPHVTVSIGCATFNMEDLNPESILRDAKQALKRAKELGKNRVAS